MKKNLEKVGIVAVFLVLGVVFFLTLIPGVSGAIMAKVGLTENISMAYLEGSSFAPSVDRQDEGHPDARTKYTTTDLPMKRADFIPEKFRPVVEQINKRFPTNVITLSVYDDDRTRWIVWKPGTVEKLLDKSLPPGQVSPL